MATSKSIDIKNAVMSFAKAIPIIAGGLAGVFLPPEKGWASVYHEIKRGAGEDALKSAVASYTFYNYQEPGFSMGAGTGIKTLTAGVLVTKFLNWIDG